MSGRLGRTTLAGCSPILGRLVGQQSPDHKESTMAVRCGNHGRERVYHDNTTDVRACYAGRLDRASGDTYWKARFAEREAEQERAAYRAKAQRDHTLAQEDPTRALNAQARPRSDDWHRTSLKLDHVEEGGYAIEDPTDGKLRFLEVDRPDEGKWADFIFVKVRASDERHKLGTVNPKYGTYAGKAPALVGALAMLDADGLNQSAARYGIEIGECGFCRRSLTDEDSRELGYGPVCAGHRGLPHPRARA
jgi:Family of unknown function (DUF6011)